MLGYLSVLNNQIVIIRFSVDNLIAIVGDDNYPLLKRGYTLENLELDKKYYRKNKIEDLLYG